jgi:drug/metabolite transporter (DMT)-like permease
MTATERPSKLILIHAFAAVYIVWGSTYLGILYAIETIPPWALTSMRFIVAGLCMAAASRIKGEAPLSRNEKKYSALSGVLLVSANGFVCVIEKWVPSGIAAVVIGSMPIWIMLIGWLGFQTARPDLRKIVGACIGLIGIAMIAAGDTHSNETGIFGAFAPLALCISSWLWATGTLVQRKAKAVKSGLTFLAVQMASGAATVVLISCVFEQPWGYDWNLVTARSWYALLYLIVFGSLIGFTAYSWLARNVEPHLVSTYALVNPVIAVWLGWFLVNEPITAKFIVSTVLVLIGVIILMKPTFRWRASS